MGALRLASAKKVAQIRVDSYRQLRLTSERKTPSLCLRTNLAMTHKISLDQIERDEKLSVHVIALLGNLLVFKEESGEPHQQKQARSTEKVRLCLNRKLKLDSINRNIEINSRTCIISIVSRLRKMKLAVKLST